MMSNQKAIFQQKIMIFMIFILLPVSVMESPARKVVDSAYVFSDCVSQNIHNQYRHTLKKKMRNIKNWLVTSKSEA